MNTTLDTIVLAIGPRDDDRLDRLAGVVLGVAKPTGATIVVTHVFTQGQFTDVAEELGYPKAADEDLPAILDRHQSVRHLEATFEDHGVAHEVRGVVGDVSDGIVRVATETDADRVVISGGTRSPAGKAVFGSTAQDVLIGSPCPVTYVRPESG